MKKVSLLAVIALTVLTLAASVTSANPTDASGNPYYQAPQQGQYGMQNSSAYCYWGGNNNYQPGYGTSGWNNWNCW